MVKKTKAKESGLKKNAKRAVKVAAAIGTVAGAAASVFALLKQTGVLEKANEKKEQEQKINKVLDMATPPTPTFPSIPQYSPFTPPPQPPPPPSQIVYVQTPMPATPVPATPVPQLQQPPKSLPTLQNPPVPPKKNIFTSAFI